MQAFLDKARLAFDLVPHPSESTSNNLNSAIEDDKARLVAATAVATVILTTEANDIDGAHIDTGYEESERTPKRTRHQLPLEGRRPRGDPDNSTDAYLYEIGETPLLTADEEVELSQTIEKGREAREAIEAGEITPANKRAVRKADQAKDQFIRANLRLVVSIARRYELPPRMESLDLIQEGNLGLERAVDKFDWRKGFKFSTYATWWIKQAITRAIDMKGNLINLGVKKSPSLRTALRQVKGDEDKLDDEHARLFQLSTPLSLTYSNGSYVEDGVTDLEERLPDTTPGPEHEVMATAKIDIINSLLDVLDPRAQHALRMRFGLTDGRKHSYREVGEELGVHGETARQLIKRSIVAVREQAGDLMDDLMDDFDF